MVSFKYWNDCVDPNDMDAMWAVPQVCSEWLGAGESRGKNVHLSRDLDGHLYLTPTEMNALADIVVRRHFDSHLQPMICAIAELESVRQPLATRSHPKTKETTIGIMQLLPTIAEWLSRDLGYREYEVEGNPDILYRPFTNVYFAAAYLKWLSYFEHQQRSEEFVVRAYHGGTSRATHKSTLHYWKRYLSVKESLPSRRSGDIDPYSESPSRAASLNRTSLALPAKNNKATLPSYQKDARIDYSCWDSRASSEDMIQMWNDPDVSKEWTKSGEKRGKVRFSHDKDQRPYLSQVELKAVANIIVSKHFRSNGVNPLVLCALVEMVSMRFVSGIEGKTGLMGIDYPTAYRLYKELRYRAYRVDSVDDLTKPFVSMYFGAAYLTWLSQYEGRERNQQFVIQAYLAGPTKVNLQETGPLWLKFKQILSYYEDTKRDNGCCNIL